MYQAKVNNTTYEVSVKSNDNILVNNKEFILDWLVISEKKKHLITNNKSYSVELVKLDREKKLVTIKVNNKSYDVALKDQYDILLSKLGMADMTTKKVKDIKAPMPGLVVDVLATIGKEVKEGENLLILEAMKMENVLKSPVDGIIKSITVKPTDTVEKNQILISFE